MNAPTQDFEQVLTQGKALCVWVTEFSHNMAVAKLMVGFTHVPEHSETQRVAHFFGVQQVESLCLDRDDESMEGLIGAHESPISPGFRYVLVTDQREIEFTAAEKATVHDA